MTVSIRLPESGPGTDGILTVGQTLTLTLLVQNSGETPLTSIPLSYGYDPQRLHLLAAAPAPATLTGGQVGWTELLGQGLLLPGDSVGVQMALRVLVSSSDLPAGMVDSVAKVTGGQDIYGQVAASDESHLPLRLTNPRVAIGKGVQGGAVTIGLGSAVTYTIHLTNAGDTTLAGVGVRDIFEPEHLRFVVASIRAPQIQDRGSESLLFWEDVTSDLGDIAPGQSVTFTVQFVVEGAGIQTINQVQTAAVVDEFGDEGVNVSGEVSLALGIAVVDLRVTSTPPQGGEVAGGDRITYTLAISNAGGVDLSGVWLRTQVPTNTELILGSVQPPAEDARGTASQLIWRLPALAQNGQFVAQFAVQVRSEQGGGLVVSRSEVASDQTPVARPAVVVHTALPTAVELLRFIATTVGEGVLVEWVTGEEIGSWGFHLWRSEDGVFAHSRRAADGLLPATGSNGGATYRFVDRGVARDRIYWYWLEEVEIDGDRLFYGPVRSVLPAALDGGYQLFLPAVVR